MSDSIKKIATALCKAQGAMENAVKGSQGYGYKYADLASVISAGKEAMKTNGLAISQTMEPNHEVAIVITTLMHDSGQWIRSSVAIKPVKPDPQGMGSAITYARRYGYQAILGLSAEDDDANTASKPTGVKGGESKELVGNPLTRCSMQIVDNCNSKKGIEIPDQVKTFSVDKKHKIICYMCQEEMKKLKTW